MDDNASMITADAPDRLLTPSQAAKLLGIHISTVRRWISQGKLPAYRIGDRRVRIRAGDIERVITPLHTTIENGGHIGEGEPTAQRPLASAEQERGLRVLHEMRR